MNPFQEYFINVLKYKYFQPQGRARRKEYWMYTLFMYVIALVLISVTYAISETLGSIVYVLFILGTIAPGVTLGIRRLHDIGKSGWWMFISLVPFVGGIVLLVFLCLDSQPGENMYGPNPKGL
jgi:Predicted membrane protein